MNIHTSCSGCYPIYQHNQLAHMDEGGCLYCSEIFDTVTVSNDDFTIESSPDSILECSICYENIDKQKNNCTTECGHSFCFKCIATSISYKNLTCPCCRSILIDNIQNNGYEIVSESESVSEVESNSDSESYTDSDEETYEDLDEDNNVCDVDEIISRIDKNGFSKDDIISMLIGRYKKNDSKYTDEYIYNINKNLDKLIKDADNETKEQKMFSKEDIRF